MTVHTALDMFTLVPATTPACSGSCVCVSFFPQRDVRAIRRILCFFLSSFFVFLLYLSFVFHFSFSSSLLARRALSLSRRLFYRQKGANTTKRDDSRRAGVGAQRKARGMARGRGNYCCIPRCIAPRATGPGTLEF